MTGLSAAIVSLKDAITLIQIMNELVFNPLALSAPEQGLQRGRVLTRCIGNSIFEALGELLNAVSDTQEASHEGDLQA